MRSFAPFLVLACASAFGQTLTLDEALRLAKERNGTVRAAVAQVQASKSREKQAAGAFLPTLTPQLQYRDSRQENLTGVPQTGLFAGNRTVVSSDWTSSVVASWRLLDSGERDLNLRSSRRAQEAETFTAQQSLRSTLFQVHSRYYDALRGRELVKVQEAQVERSKRIVAQIEAQIKVGEAAEKDRLQPLADQLNAAVNLLSARNRVATSDANLKATIGWALNEKLPDLQTYAEPDNFSAAGELDALWQEALQNRADLRAQRKRLEGQRLNARRVRLGAGVTYNLDASYTKQFGPDNSNNRLLQFTASVPLFDGARSREAAKEADLGVEATLATLEQAERDARGEVEAAWTEYQLNAERIPAAKAALEAARTNFERVLLSNQLGAANVTVVDISTAQVTLVTAEVNAIEARYDFLISRVRLDLALGRPVTGE